MKLRIAFIADVTVSGGKVSKEDLVSSCVEWLYDSDSLFTDSFVDYVPESIEFDSIELTIDKVSVK